MLGFYFVDTKIMILESDNDNNTPANEKQK
jgi:hypothetical protein